MTDNPQEHYHEVTKKATRGMGWKYLSFGLSKGLNILTVSILAHLLAPEYFGVVALATLTMDYLSTLGTLGLGSALVHRREKIEQAANVAFTLDLAVSIVLALITFAIAPYAAIFFKEPQVTPILRWLSLTFFISSFGMTQSVLLERDLNFQKKIIPELVNTLAKAAVSIGLAFAGLGVWALVIGQIAGNFISTATYWFLLSWRPKLSWDKTLAKELLGYGVSIMGNNILTVWEQNFDYFVIGLVYDPVALGIYTLAYRLPQALVLNTLWVMTSVLFPAFSSLQNQREKLKKSFFSVLRYVELLVTPLCLGMIVAADPIIRVLFGEQWVDAIPILRVLSLYAWVVSIGYHVGDIYKAIGRPDILTKMNVPMFFIRLFLLWFGAQYSLLGVAFGHLAAILIEFLIRYFVAAHFLKITVAEVVRELTAFVCGVPLAIFAVLALHLTRNSPSLVQLIVVTIAGGAGYLGAVWLIERNSILKALQLIGVKRSEA
ncbi:MAG: lipopolysaccharide biosynthesis protein [Chloroflexi bacterium]|nr:lipopolysaccharide biosynthesis protein [Chloroflexota bacterium]